jgi:gamma-glutamyl-gamma-aminobutyrate hydrolase PuuD
MKPLTKYMVRTMTSFKVFIVGYSPNYAKMFTEEGWYVVSDIKDADCVVFPGGPDIDPRMYGEAPHPLTRFVENVDDRELAILSGVDQLCVGICRGAQLLNVMAGGSLWQHVDGHNNGHHAMRILETDRQIEVSSSHHQMMRPGQGAAVLAVSEESTYREGVTTAGVETWFRGDQKDPEVVYYEEEKFLCYQPTPQKFDKNHFCRRYFFELLEKYAGVD